MKNIFGYLENDSLFSQVIYMPVEIDETIEDIKSSVRYQEFASKRGNGTYSVDVRFPYIIGTKVIEGIELEVDRVRFTFTKKTRLFKRVSVSVKLVVTEQELKEQKDILLKAKERFVKRFFTEDFELKQESEIV